MEERLQYLLRQYENNNCSREELEELFSYIRNTGSNDASLQRMLKKIYGDIRKNHPSFLYVDENGYLVFMEPGQEIPVEKEAPSKRNAKPALWIFMLTGALMISAALWLTRKGIPGNRSQTGNNAIVLTKKFSERSEQKFLLLPDSTRVWLNAASSLEFPDKFTGNKKEVTLSGEAFFEVRNTPDTAFIVHTGKVSTAVSGGSFDIKAYPREREVTVSVSRGKAAVKRNGNIVATLVRSQQAKIDIYGEEITEKNITGGKIAAWQQGEMIYDNEPLTYIIADLERAYNVKISIFNNEALSMKISASFKKDIGVSQALLILCKLTGTTLDTGNGHFEIK
jgi:ferric-dicitrate binding protein FerR (iron transport regulator)